MVVTDFPAIIAPNESPTFAIKLRPKDMKCFVSKRFIDSSAKVDIVVNEPQNPIAIKMVYFESRFRPTDRAQNIPSTKLPSTFTIRVLTGKIPNSMRDEAILYRRKAPAKAPTESNSNSIPFIFSPIRLLLIGIISILKEAVLVTQG